MGRVLFSGIAFNHIGSHNFLLSLNNMWTRPYKFCLPSFKQSAWWLTTANPWSQVGWGPPVISSLSSSGRGPRHQLTNTPLETQIWLPLIPFPLLEHMGGTQGPFYEDRHLPPNVSSPIRSAFSMSLGQRGRIRYVFSDRLSLCLVLTQISS